MKTNYMAALSTYHYVIMYKYKIYDYKWYEFISVIFKNIDSYVLSRLNEGVQCDAIAIRELCESRDYVMI